MSCYAAAENGPEPDQEDRVMLMCNRVPRIYYKRHFFDYPLSMKLQTFINMGLVTTVCAAYSYLWRTIFKREDRSLEDFTSTGLAKCSTLCFSGAARRNCRAAISVSSRRTGAPGGSRPCPSVLSSRM